MSLLEVRDLHVWFDLTEDRQLHAVQGVSFEVNAGERMGLVGEAGCGKTTAILSVLSLLPPSATVSGDIRLEGASILDAPDKTVRTHRWNDIAMVFQGAMNALNPVKNVVSQLVEPMEMHGIASGSVARKAAGELLELVGIPGAAGSKYPHEFSGGMRQRAMIAMALACRPKVLLADEPTTALDVMVQAQILELLKSVTEELGLALVLVTHDLPVVAQVCERAAVMYAGRIVEAATMDQLFHTPLHPYTRLLFAATPDLYGEEQVSSIPGGPPRLDEELIGCPFHTRCDRAFDRCRRETPELLILAESRAAACHLNDDVVVSGADS
jgi:oligopeptide/dipeptide ABC transporter ATP-binding protein